MFDPKVGKYRLSNMSPQWLPPQQDYPVAIDAQTFSKQEIEDKLQKWYGLGAARAIEVLPAAGFYIASLHTDGEQILWTTREVRIDDDGIVHGTLKGGEIRLSQQ